MLHVLKKCYLQRDEVVIDKRNGLKIAVILRCFGKILFREYQLLKEEMCEAVLTILI
jgi:hypothetical protein